MNAVSTTATRSEMSQEAEARGWFDSETGLEYDGKILTVGKFNQLPTAVQRALFADSDGEDVTPEEIGSDLAVIDNTEVTVTSEPVLTSEPEVVTSDNTDDVAVTLVAETLLPTIKTAQDLIAAAMVLSKMLPKTRAKRGSISFPVHTMNVGDTVRLRRQGRGTELTTATIVALNEDNTVIAEWTANGLVRQSRRCVQNERIGAVSGIVTV